MRIETSIASFRHFMAVAFSTMFFVLAFALTMTTANTIAGAFSGQMALTEAFLKAINIAVVGMAVLELGLVVNTEYACHSDDNIGVVLTRTLPRFVSIVCIALVLEGLLMVIKYSQLELAGNLYYPVAVIVSASLLLASLGIFLRFSAAGLQQTRNSSLALSADMHDAANETIVYRP